MNATVLAERLQAVLDQVWSIRLDWQDPERFHIARGEAVGSLKALITEADQLQNSAPAVTTKAQAALRLLEASAHPAASALPRPVPAVSTPEPEPASSVEGEIESAGSVAEPSEAPNAASGVSPPAAKRAFETAQAIDLTLLQQSIAGAVAAITHILGDIEKLALAASAAYTTALALPSQIVPPHVPQAAVPVTPTTASPASADPHTFYHRGHLLTEEGRVIAASLWADGVSRNDIARCFDYTDNHGPACVSAAIATFLRVHCPAEAGILAGEAGKEQVRHALRALGCFPGQAARVVTQKSTSVARKRGNGHGSDNIKSAGPLMVANNTTTAAVDQAPACVKRTRSELGTDGGRAVAAEMWINGVGQKAIGRLFGYEQSGEPYVSLAIAGFIKRQCRLVSLNAIGDQRKLLARDALQRYRATTAAAQPASGDHHAGG
jgi:hypothetical protein